MGHRIAGKRLGILGLGRIGRAIAARAAPFGLEVHYHARRRVHPEIEAEPQGAPGGRASTRCWPASTS